MSETLREYIRKSITQGLKKEQVEANLLQAGWRRELVAQVFEDIEFSQKELIERHRKSIFPSRKVLGACFKRIIAITMIAVIFLGVYFGVKYITLPKPSIIANLKIDGDKKCVTQINQAINLLRNKDPDNYQELANRIDLIKCDKFASRPEYNLKDGKGFREFKVDLQSVDAGPVWLAIIIAHETCHARQFQEFEKIKHNLSPEEAERERNTDLEAECHQVQTETMNKMGVDESTLSKDFWKNR